MFGWIGTVTGVTGGITIALNISYSKYAFLVFLISSCCWLIQGIKNKDKALIILNTVFMAIDLIGIYRWILPDLMA
jgi:hypothetical protein